VIEAGLLAPLEGEDPLTVFAPTNDAFDAILSGGSVIDPDVLKNILLYHVAEGTVTLEDGKTVTMLNGDTVLLTVTDEAKKVNDASIEAEVVASNGIVYVIDAVLIPPTDEPDVEEEEIKEPVMEPEEDPAGALAPVDFRA